MCMRAAVYGLRNDYQLVHPGRFASGGACLVIAEASAVTAQRHTSRHEVGTRDDD
jgi:hypothetical protein